MDKSSSMFLSMFFLLMLPIDVFAYLDPGTGSAILQGILGGLAALAVVPKLYWHRFLKLLGIRKSEERAEEKKAVDSTENH